MLREKYAQVIKGTIQAEEKKNSQGKIKILNVTEKTPGFKMME